MNKVCPTCKKKFNKPASESLKAWLLRHKYCSRKCYISWMKGKDLLGKNRRIGEPWNKGKKLPWLTKVKPTKNCKQCGKLFEVKPYRLEIAMFCSSLCRTDNANHGITPINEKIRKSLKYEVWRKLVFKRDKYTCQECGFIGGYLNAHHIKSFSKYPELRLDINNGTTLCTKCHKLTDTYGFGAWRVFRAGQEA